MANVLGDKSTIAYVGTYSTKDFKGEGKGLYVFQIDNASGRWTQLQVLEDVANASYLALNRERGFLYSTNEGDEAASAFAIDGASKHLTFLNKESTKGSTPASLSLDPSNRFLIVANYFGGNVAVFPIKEDGSLAPLSQLVTLEGTPGPDKVEQNTSHPHDVVFDPTGKFVFVPDKGFDKIFIYTFDADKGELTPNATPFVTVQAGAGPRHIAFHPNQRYAYVINELGNSVNVFSYDAEQGSLEQLQVISTLPEDFSGSSTGAEIQIDQSGKFLYGSNRGHDSIVVFSIDQESGKLSPVEWVSTKGKTPRFFLLDDSTERIYAANQDSSSIIVFQADQTTGKLAEVEQVEVGSPVCIITY